MLFNTVQGIIYRLTAVYISDGNQKFVRFRHLLFILDKLYYSIAELFPQMERPYWQKM